MPRLAQLLAALQHKALQRNSASKSQESTAVTSNSASSSVTSSIAARITVAPRLCSATMLLRGRDNLLVPACGDEGIDESALLVRAGKSQRIDMRHSVIAQPNNQDSDQITTASSIKTVDQFITATKSRAAQQFASIAPVSSVASHHNNNHNSNYTNQCNSASTDVSSVESSPNSASTLSMRNKKDASNLRHRSHVSKNPHQLHLSTQQSMDSCESLSQLTQPLEDDETPAQLTEPVVNSTQATTDSHQSARFDTASPDEPRIELPHNTLVINVLSSSAAHHEFVRAAQYFAQHRMPRINDASDSQSSHLKQLAMQDEEMSNLATDADLSRVAEPLAVQHHILRTSQPGCNLFPLTEPQLLCVTPWHSRLHTVCGTPPWLLRHCEIVWLSRRALLHMCPGDFVKLIGRFSTTQQRFGT